MTSSGAVSSLKDKFDLSSPSSAGLRGSSSGGYASSSLDRYTGRSLGSDYTPTSSKLGSGYTSDVDRSGTQSYGGAGSTYSSTWSQPTSYVPSSSRTSRADYNRSSSRDLGSSYGPSSSSQSSGTDASRAKSSYYSLTPFETRRTAKTTDLNLTPYTSRVTGDSAKPSYERQTSAGRSVSRQVSSEDAKTMPKSKTVLSDSSDSEPEPKDVSKRDPNVRYLTSRATSPMEIDRDEYDMRKKPDKNRNRLLSRTKTKTYPVGDRKRRRQLKNIHIQVDGEELDKYCGRVRINREKLAKYAAPENKYAIPRYGPSVAAIASTIDDKSSTATKGSSSSSVGGRGEGETSVSTGGEEPKGKPVLPKQSVFVPRDRKTPRNNFQDEDDVNDVPVNIRKTMASKDRNRKDEAKEEDREQGPKQSSFLERKWHQQEEAEKQEKQEKTTKQLQKQQKDKAAPADMTLKESIEKVRSWKKQLQHGSPDSGDEDENRIELYGKDEWRKKNLKNKKTNETSKDTTTLSPPRSIRSPSGSDMSEIGFLRDSSPNVEVSENLKKDKRKLVAGVPKFPLTSENIVDDEKQSNKQKQKQKQNKDRSPSPYDNLKAPSTTNQRSISPYDNLEKADGSQTGKRLLGRAFPSTESLGGFGGDVSSEDDDIRGVSSKGRRPTTLKPKVQKGSSTNSLPDLVTSSEGVRRSEFIGKLRDIDSLLGYSETEDDAKPLSDSESDSSDESSSDESSTNKRNIKKNNNNKRPVLRSGAKIVLSPVSEDKSSSTERQSVSPSRHPDDITLVGESEDIDEILDADIVPKFLGSATPETTPDSARVVTNPLLRLDITPPQIDLSSSESLLDTPVPDTPDIPLSPVPAFFGSKDSRKTQSMDQLNHQADQIGRPLQTKSKDKLRQQQQHAPPPDRTQSFGDLDDLGGLLGIANGTPRIGAQHGRVEHQADAKHQRPVHRQTTVGGIPIETLVDLSFDDTTDAVVAAPQEITTPVAKRFYPPGYCDTAIKEAIARHQSNGQVTISELVEICKKPLKRKPPWVEDEEDRRFAGYKEIDDALENMEVDIKKVGTHSQSLR